MPVPDPVESIGALLARVRTGSGRSQLRLAELLCAASGTPTVSRHEVSRWEREQRLPSMYWLRWRILRRVERDTCSYTDLATTPVQDHEFEEMQIYTTTPAARRWR